MPAYCIVAIPELSSYMEASASDTGVVRESDDAIARVLGMTYTRRSATRYMVDINLDEEYYAAASGGSDLEITLNSISPGGAALDTINYPNTNKYTLPVSAIGEKSPRTGSFRFDLRFDGPLSSLYIGGPLNLSITGGEMRTTDSDTKANSIDATGVSALTII